MPGKRNLARERAQHDQPATFARIHHDLRSQLPDLDRALVGHVAILAELHRLGLRRLNGTKLSWRIVLRWRRDHAFPLHRGIRKPDVYAAPPLSTTHAMTAWILSQFVHGELFRVVAMADAHATGSFTTTPTCDAAA